MELKTRTTTTRATQSANTINQANKNASLDRDAYQWSDMDLLYRLGQIDKYGNCPEEGQSYFRRADGSPYNVNTMTPEDWAELRELQAEGKRRGVWTGVVTCEYVIPEKQIRAEFQSFIKNVKKLADYVGKERYSAVYSDIVFRATGDPAFRIKDSKFTLENYNKMLAIDTLIRKYLESDRATAFGAKFNMEDF